MTTTNIKYFSLSDLKAIQVKVLDEKKQRESLDSLMLIFFEPLRGELLSRYKDEKKDIPHINFDDLKGYVSQLLGDMNDDQINDLRKLGVRGKSTSKQEWDKDPRRRAMLTFLSHYPHFTNSISNIHILAELCIEITRIHFESEINTENFVDAKAFIDKINLHRWRRDKDQSERQSGVSILGSISELLLENALENLIDDQNFFKTNNQKVQSYGDFVLMCLPNNLWLSVKSNFARERLLASGYTTDILGVGFFTDSREFISSAKIRNFQRVGFLGMYLPDIPITEDQIELSKSTYEQVVEYYGSVDDLPININGTTFLRPLSSLHSDLTKILDSKDISKRTTLGY